MYNMHRTVPSAGTIFAYYMPHSRSVSYIRFYLQFNPSNCRRCTLFPVSRLSLCIIVSHCLEHSKITIRIFLLSLPAPIQATRVDRNFNSALNTLPPISINHNVFDITRYIRVRGITHIQCRWV